MITNKFSLAQPRHCLYQLESTTTCVFLIDLFIFSESENWKIQKESEGQKKKRKKENLALYLYPYDDDCVINIRIPSGVCFSSPEALLAAKQTFIAMAPPKLFVFALSVALIFFLVGAEADVSIEQPDSSAIKIQLDQLNSKIQFLGMFSHFTQKQNKNLIVLVYFLSIPLFRRF